MQSVEMNLLRTRNCPGAYQSAVQIDVNTVQIAACIHVEEKKGRKKAAEYIFYHYDKYKQLTGQFLREEELQAKAVFKPRNNEFRISNIE